LLGPGLHGLPELVLEALGDQGDVVLAVLRAALGAAGRLATLGLRAGVLDELAGVPATGGEGQCGRCGDRQEIEPVDLHVCSLAVGRPAWGLGDGVGVGMSCVDTGWWVRWSLATATSLGAPLAEVVGEDRDEDDDPDDDGLPLGLDRHDPQTVDEDAHDERADERALDRAAAPEERGAADDDGGDRLELVAHAEL